MSDLISGLRDLQDRLASLELELKEARLQWQASHDAYLVQRTRSEHLETDLFHIQARLDYYQNISTSMISRLSHVGMIVEDVLRESREEAQSAIRRPSPGAISTPLPPLVLPLTQEEKEEEELKKIASLFSPAKNPEETSNGR